MTTVTVDDVIRFAARVEQVCDFVLDGVEKDGSDDVVLIQKLKEDAADLQFITKNANVSIKGLSEFMKGVNLHEVSSRTT